MTFTLQVRQSWLLRPSLSCPRKAVERAGGWELGAGKSASAQRERAPGEIRLCCAALGPTLVWHGEVQLHTRA